MNSVKSVKSSRTIYDVPEQYSMVEAFLNQTLLPRIMTFEGQRPLREWAKRSNPSMVAVYK